MKKNRIIQRTVSAFLAAAMLATLASCDTKLPGSRNNTDGFTNQPRQIMNYYTSEMLAVPDGFGYAQNIFCNDENIFIYGSKSNDSAEILSGIYDFGAKELKELNLSDLNADYISSVAYIGKDLAVSYWESETNSQKITIFGMKIKRILIQVLNGEKTSFVIFEVFLYPFFNHLFIFIEVFQIIIDTLLSFFLIFLLFFFIES